MKITLLTVMLVFLMPKDSQQADPYPLSMMELSVDDMYDGCEAEMGALESKYLEDELNKDISFPEGWNNAQSCENEKYETRKNTKLTKNQIRALCVYTEKKNEVYGLLNAAVRKGKPDYIKNTFQFSALHYLLTSAIKTINAEKPECLTTYRRNSVIFTGDVGSKMRFGQFASSSKSSTKIATFGKETCFHIETCFGAFVQDYSVEPDEEEVLIPPYEVFVIEKKETGSTTTLDGLKDCTTIFKLKSVEKDSKLNCMVNTRVTLSKMASFIKNNHPST